MKTLSLKLHTVFLALVAMTSGGVAADWPQWRGPTRDGKVSGAPWPTNLGPSVLKQAWRVPLAPSYSGPVVFGERVFTTETSNKTTEVVRALDRTSGKELWLARWEGAVKVPFFAKSNGDWIRSTPACDGESLYVAGMRDVLVCLDAATGKERWRLDFVKKLSAPVPDFGFVCSPLVDGDFVFVQAGAGFAKVNKRTGDLVWHTLKDKGGMWGSAFSSPVIADIAGVRQLVVQSREKLAGVAIDDGRVLWSQPVEAFRGMNILTPVVHGDAVFTSTYGGKTTLFSVARKGDSFSVTRTWETKEQGYMSTPVVIEGVAYEHLKSQRAAAFDLKTGKSLWTTDQSFGKYWSLVANGSQVLALDQRGRLFLFRANPQKFELLDQRKVSESETWAHLAVAGDELFIRELDGLSAWRWGAAKP